MTTYFKQTLYILRVLLRDTFSTDIKKERKLASRLGGLLASGLFVIFFLAMAVAFGIIFAGIDDGAYMPTTFVGASQLLVLLLGLFSVIGVLYSSKDNQLLASMPLKTSQVFLAKMLYLYLTQLTISALIIIPSTLSFGITRAVMCGYSAVGTGYFVYSILSVFFAPLIPILFISVLTLPLMYLLSYIKKNNVVNVIMSVLLALAVMGISLALEVGSSGMEEESSQDILAAFVGIDRIFIFNRFLRLALSTRSAQSIGWFFAYVGEVLVVGAIAILLSALCYGSLVKRGFEEGVSKKKKKSDSPLVYKAGNFKKTFLKKELLNLLNTPELLVNVIMAVVMIPVAIIFMSVSFSFDVEVDPEENFNAVSFMFPFALYIATMIGCFSNIVASTAFSVEGKNFYLLKSFPVDVRVMIGAKKLLSYFMTFLISAIAAVSILVMLCVLGSTPLEVVVGTLSTVLIVVLPGLGYDNLAIANDLKKINLKWQNLQEITRKNKNIYSLNMIFMIVLVVAIIASIVLNVMLGTEIGASNLELIAIDAGIYLLIGATVFAIGLSKNSVDVQKYFDEVE